MTTKAHVIIEAESAALAEELVTKHNLKHSLVYDGKQYQIPLFIFDHAIEVKVKDLPPHMSNTTIAKHLAAYGEVLSIKDEIWSDFFAGLPSVVRSVRIRLRKSIPSYVNIEEELAYITYRNQIRTCRHCTRALHIGRSCADVRRELANNNEITAADLLKGPVTTNPPRIPPALETTQNTSESVSFVAPAASIEKSAAIITAPPIVEKSDSHTAVKTRSSSRPSSQTRSSSLSRRPLGNSQTAGPSRIGTSNAFQLLSTNVSSSETSFAGYDISDGEHDTRKESQTKRPGSPSLVHNENVEAKKLHNSRKQK